MTEKTKEVPLQPQQKLVQTPEAGADDRRKVFEALEKAPLPTHVIPGEDQKLSDEAPPVAERWTGPPPVAEIPKQGDPTGELEQAAKEEAASESEPQPDAEPDPAPAPQRTPEEEQALLDARKHLALSRIDPDALGLSDDAILALGEQERQNRISRDAIMRENATLRQQQQPATEPSAELETPAEPGRPPAPQPPAAPPADIAKLTEPLLTPLGLDANDAKAVGQVMQQVATLAVEQATAPLNARIAELDQGMGALAGRTLQADLGERFPAVRGDAAKLNQLIEVANANAGAFQTYDEAVAFAARGLGFEAAAEPAAKEEVKPTPRQRKVSSSPVTRERPKKELTRDEQRRAYFNSLDNK